PMFDFFAHHALPDDEQIRQIDFATMNPGVSATCHWATIVAQIRPLERSSVSIRCDPGKRRFAGTTRNVAELALDLSSIGSERPDSVELDGQRVGRMQGASIVRPPIPTSAAFLREAGKW